MDDIKMIKNSLKASGKKVPKKMTIVEHKQNGKTRKMITLLTLNNLDV